VVAAYIEHSNVSHSFINPIEVPSLPIDPAKNIHFNFALHESYSDLNGLEEEFAVALDKTQRVWFRNSSRGLFEIPLLTSTGTKNFNPDFIVWVDKAIIAIDTKGDHLIKEDAGRKLFYINKTGNGLDLIIRLVTRGTWDDRVEKNNANGFTVWGIRNGKPHPIHAESVNEAAQICLR
jgi:type III restriction enzyme